MGPLASAAFLTTIYEESAGVPEQQLPSILLMSDPTIPDRTEAFLSGRESELAADVTTRAQRLIDAGATNIVMCCVTLHHLLPLLPPPIQKRVVSLVDVIVDHVAATPGRHLLLCTEGTRRSRMFEDHERWKHARDRIVLPNEADQRAIHSLIYNIKRNRSSDQHLRLIARLTNRYAVESCIAGCTEIHIVAKKQWRAAARSPLRWIDPLSIVARQICGAVAPSSISGPAAMNRHRLLPVASRG